MEGKVEADILGMTVTCREGGSVHPRDSREDRTLKGKTETDVFGIVGVIVP
jgi:hypothetical protein